MHQAIAIAGPLLVWGALVVWQRTAHGLDCLPVALGFSLLVTSLVLSGTEIAFYRRHAFLGHYLNPRGRLFRLLGRRWLILIRQLVQSIFLALLLLVAALSLQPLQWVLLLADLVLLLVLIAVLSSLLSEEIREPYRQPMIRHWAARTNALVLWLSLVLLMYVSPQENYVGLRWEEVLSHQAHQIQVRCDVLAIPARLGAVGEALALWLAQERLAVLKDSDQLLAAWFVFIAGFGASLVVAWAYSRALVGIFARPWSIWRQAPLDNSD